ncbi:aspartate--tRNA ligase, mitochondrial-like [Tubulanus polymorphus]|uniref:aspartate--tRNA ligase, mitochondrial-like n=1 Tax=Tubulanus polymorphus TaxID=672921 RepID=UPI003DA6792C
MMLTRVYRTIITEVMKKSRATINISYRIINRNIYTSFTGYQRCRSHTCGDLSQTDEGRQVTLCGWLQYQRYGLFFTLRDAYGATQVILPTEKDDKLVELISRLNYESVLKVSGMVKCRPPGQENKNMKTGDIEIHATDIEVLNEAVVTPFEIRDQRKVKETMRMEYRYLDLRSAWMQRNLRLRSQVTMKMRQFLCDDNGFVDVETPTLFRKTPGGAQEFVVPTKHAGKFYCLPQSPQQFKQLLMVGGLDRYMQIARCYRDESNRPDRQPEFTQLDLEMSFIGREDIYCLIENLLVHSWPKHLPALTTPPPFPRLKYTDVMNTFGTDAPDVRYSSCMLLHDITDVLKDSGVDIFTKILAQNRTSAQAICIKQGMDHFKKKDVNQLEESFKTINILQLKSAETWQGKFAKHFSENVKQRLIDHLQAEVGDIIIISVGSHSDTRKLMGRVRVDCIKNLELKGRSLKEKEGFNFVWVEDFPLFDQKEDGSDGLESTHHPFTAPHPEDEHLLQKNPEKVRSLHYDLVLNGAEIGGGSIRIHDSNLQKHILENILQENSSQLEHLLKAFKYGCPPHGGIALGLDRLLSIMVGAPSIRDVIAFPKSELRDPMSDAPAPISEQDLKHYKIKIFDEDCR